jgi:hypothetical protein
MSESILTDQAKEKVDNLSQSLYRGELPNDDFNADSPREIERIVLKYIENQGFESVIPEETSTLDSLRGSSRKVLTKKPDNSFW